jgi:hypothetical protein
MRARNAIIAAAALEVLCPECGGAQPNPDDGSHMWSADQVRASAGKRTCTECDEPFVLHAQSKAQVSP